jgi:hypothetical protein
MRILYNILVGKSRRKRPLAIPRRRCRQEDNITMNLAERLALPKGLNSRFLHPLT